MSLAPGTRLGPYEVVAVLGAGGMGEVYRARDTRLGRDVAIKVLPAEFAADPDRLRRFEQEARAASALNHPNILVVHDIGSHEGAPYLVSELLEGESLRDRLRDGALPVRTAVDIAVQMAHGLAAAHEKGIVHRDLKPENVFVTRSGHVKILDFGLAKLADSPLSPAGAAEASTFADGTRAGIVLGTVGYMAPEQARGQAVDHRADIFALGCVLYEMLAGKRAFAGDTAADTLTAILNQDPAPLSGLGSGAPPGLQGIVQRSLEKRPADRFSSAHDLALALNAVAEALLTGQLPVESSGKSIVVLPFDNLSPDPENAFFADGLTEELIADLSKVRTLRVISRTSAMLLRGSKKDVPTIAKELNVRYVLEGSVRRAGNSLRITAQLIDAASDTHVWAEKYNGTLDDVFAIQEKVSRAIVDALKLTLTADERHRLAARMIPNVKAFDLYLEARQEAYQGMTERALDRAVRLTSQALDVVGPNPLLYALLAEIEFIYHDQGIHRDEESLRRGESWARKALELEPETAAAFRALGAIEARRGDMVRAIRDLRRANELQVSGETLCFLAWRCSEVGEMAEARRYVAEAVAVDPLLWFCRWSQAWVALLDGDFEAALRRWQDALGSKSDELIKTYFSAIFSAYAGRMGEACDLFGQIVDTGAPAFSMVAVALRALFRRDTETSVGLLGNDALRDVARPDKEFSWWLAAGCSFAGQTDEALHWLSNSIDLGFVNHHFFSTIDPFLAALRGDTRFEALMERAREKQRAFGVTPSAAAPGRRP
jgi:serine/threonine protein kinase/tetratricopeptide (TPR) repeat protein